MVKLRLTRIGKTHSPSYRVIAIQARTKRSGMPIEYLGFYNPMTKPSVLELNKERIEYWLSVGAQPTHTVKYLLAREGIIKIEKKQYSMEPGENNKARAAKKQEKAAAAKEAKKAPKAKAEAPAEAEVKEEAPAAEATTEETTETAKAE